MGADKITQVAFDFYQRLLLHAERQLGLAVGKKATKVSSFLAHRRDNSLISGK